MKPGRKVIAVILLITSAAGAAVYYSADPAAGGYFPPCPFVTIFQVFCPGCGSQRAFHDLLHGRVLAAADHNLLFLVFLPLLASAAAITLINVFAGTRYAQRIIQSAFFARSVLVAVLLFWVLRNLPWYPFSWLAP